MAEVKLKEEQELWEPAEVDNSVGREVKEEPDCGGVQSHEEAGPTVKEEPEEMGRSSECPFIRVIVKSEDDEEESVHETVKEQPDDFGDWTPAAVQTHFAGDSAQSGVQTAPNPDPLSLGGELEEKTQTQLSITKQSKQTKMPARVVEPWSHDEVEVFLGIMGDDEIQRQLNAATRNDKVFQRVAATMVEAGYKRTAAQCRCKSKKMRAIYKAMKDQNKESGRDRKDWRYFATMDAIYGHRPSCPGREAASQEDSSAGGSTNQSAVTDALSSSSTPAASASLLPSTPAVSTSFLLSTPSASATFLPSLPVASAFLLPPSPPASSSLLPSIPSASSSLLSPTPAPSAPPYASTSPPEAHEPAHSNAASGRRLAYGKRKRGQDFDATVRAIQESDAAFREDYRRAVRDMVQTSRDHLQQDAEFNRNLLQQAADFNASFLALMSQLVKQSRRNSHH